MVEQHKNLLKRIYTTQDGKDFVEEILKPWATINYHRLLHSTSENRAEQIGFGQCLYELIKVFENSVEDKEKQLSMFDV